MNTPTWLRASLLVLAGAGLAAFARSEPPSRQWEHLCATSLYKPMSRNPYQAQRDSMNRLGALGWELVAVSDTETSVAEYCFKRPHQP